jgi:hypothetical protein
MQGVDTMTNPRPEADEVFMLWLDTGVAAGWISDVVCVTHQGLPSTDEEDKEWDDGFDPCVFGMRLWAGQ